MSRAAALALLAVAVACSGKGEREASAGAGRRVHSGPVRALKASADGVWLAFLEGCSEVRAQALPPRTASCDLGVVPAAGGAVRKISGGVTTLPQGFGWSPSGDLLAAVGEYDYVLGAGTLVLARGGGEPARVSESVTFQGFTPGGARVGAIARGRLLLAEPGKAPEWLSADEGLTSFDLNPAPRPGMPLALAHRAGASGGVLLAVSGQGAATPIAARVGDYAFAPGGAAYAYTVLGAGGGYTLKVAAGGAPVAVAGQVHGFQFSPDGAALAYVAEMEPGKQGNLHLAPVGKVGPVVGREVGEYRWAARAPRIAWLERYDPRVRSGTLGVGGPGMAARTLAPNVSDVEISPDGRHVAFLQHTTRGGYSVDLGAVHLDAPKESAREDVAHGVFGFAYSPDGAWLYYRTRCTRNAEACDLERVPSTGLPKGARPEQIAQQVKSFEFDPHDPGRLLVTWQRVDMAALDVAVWERGKLTRVDERVVPGSAQFLGPDARRVAYAVALPKRAGVYVAEVPRAAESSPAAAAGVTR